LQGKKNSNNNNKKIRFDRKKNSRRWNCKKKKQFQKSSKIKQVVIIRMKIKSDR
jgi:hypothetical protein